MLSRRDLITRTTGLAVLVAALPPSEFPPPAAEIPVYDSAGRVLLHVPADRADIVQAFSNLRDFAVERFGARYADTVFALLVQAVRELPEEVSDAEAVAWIEEQIPPEVRREGLEQYGRWRGWPDAWVQRALVWEGLA